MSEDWIEPKRHEPIAGAESFRGLDATVSDFWAFAMSDLRANNVRGYLAEFLVARALGASGPRTEWADYDVLTPEGIRVEVKSSGRLQSWPQRAPSRVNFTRLRGRVLLAENRYSEEATYNADVYVFAIQTATSHDEYDPLDVSQWEFHVVASSALAATGHASLGLAGVMRLSGGPVSYSALASAVHAVR